MALLSVVSGAIVLALIDYYVYRNWKRFVRYRRPFGWTLPLYRVLMSVMPLLLPVYALTTQWWAVEPKLPRALILGLWLVYYVPKVLIAVGILVKDLIHFVTWLFGWFQEQLLPSSPPPLAPVAVPSGTQAAPNRLDLTDMKRVPRREFLEQMGWSAATVPFVVVGYGVFKTLYDFEVHHVDVPITGLPRQLDGLTIAQLSDLHAGSFFSTKPMEEVADIVHRLRPDVVTITGDFVNGDAAELPLILPALNRMKADLGVYACLGNHDHYARTGDVVDGVGTTPVDLLVNEHRTFEIDGARLHLVGTDNTGFRQQFANLPRAMAGIPDERTGTDARILLAHDPTFWDEHVRDERPDVDLMLCGHTHGGQIGFEVGPLRWGIARIAYQRWAGLYSEPRTDGSRQHLYVNRGTGTVGPPLRLGIRPEITLLTLRAA